MKNGTVFKMKIVKDSKKNGWFNGQVVFDDKLTSDDVGAIKNWFDKQVDRIISDLAEGERE